MKQHHLAFKAIEQSLVIEARRVASEIKLHVPPLSKPVVMALFDVIAEFAGDALEGHMWTEAELRAFLGETREVITRRKVRPKISALQSELLRSLGTQTGPATLGELSRNIYVSHVALMTAIQNCMNRRLIRRTLRGKVAYYELTDKASEYRQANEITIAPNALIPKPLLSASRRVTAAHGPRLKNPLSTR